MKKQALALVGLFVFIASTGTVFAAQNVSAAPVAITISAKVTLAEARKTALLKMEGKVEDSYTVEDDNGKAIAYAFVIKNKAGKYCEVQVSMETGEVTKVEVYEES